MKTKLIHQTLSNVIWRHYLHPEDEFRPDGGPYNAYTRGLVWRRPIKSMTPLRKLMRESGASQHAIERLLHGDRIHPGDARGWHGQWRTWRALSKCR